MICNLVVNTNPSLVLSKRQLSVTAPTVRGKQKVHTAPSWGAQGSARMTAECFTMALRLFLCYISESAWFSVAISHTLSSSCSYIQEVQIATTLSFLLSSRESCLLPFQEFTEAIMLPFFLLFSKIYLQVLSDQNFIMFALLFVNQQPTQIYVMCINSIAWCPPTHH